MEAAPIITACIQAKTPISFCKYGDGEYGCMIGWNGCNCDADGYTTKKRLGLLAALPFMVDQLPNAYIGMWHTAESLQWMQRLATKPVVWANYHSIMLESYSPEKIELYRTIKRSDMKKVYLCNALLAKAQLLFDIDHMIYVPLNNWFDDMVEGVVEQIAAVLDPTAPCIVMMSAGMGAKIVVYLLAQRFPHHIYLDFGSALDKICTKHTSRGWEPAYETTMEWLKELLPPDWDDPKYEPIYEQAKMKLGLHLKT